TVALVVAAEGYASRHYSAGLADGAECAQKRARECPPADPAAPAAASQRSLWHSDCDALFQRLVRVYVLYGADHANRSGDGTVAARKQFYRARRNLLYFGVVRAASDCSLQHQYHSADGSGDPDCRPAGA